MKEGKILGMTEKQFYFFMMFGVGVTLLAIGFLFGFMFGVIYMGG